jgi:uncharacterized RDD family membrane protein YckC
MKNIEINTTQNVVLQYELAPLRDRIAAFLLDAVIIGVTFLILSAFMLAMFSGSREGAQAVTLLLLCVFSFYSLAFEFLNKGRSPGKMALKIQVIKLSGSQATFSDFAARWVFRLIDIFFSLGGVAVILITSSSKMQRIGDIVANTAVVKTVPKLNIDLDDLLGIHKSNKYIPKYQQAKKLQEKDALLIKATLERRRRFNNEAHDEAVDQLCQRVQELLGIDFIAEKKSVFLQTILQDYVVLSR